MTRMQNARSRPEARARREGKPGRLRNFIQGEGVELRRHLAQGPFAIGLLGVLLGPLAVTAVRLGGESCGGYEAPIRPRWTCSGRPSREEARHRCAQFRNGRSAYVPAAH